VERDWKDKGFGRGCGELAAGLLAGTDGLDDDDEDDEDDEDDDEDDAGFGEGVGAWLIDSSSIG